MKRDGNEGSDPDKRGERRLVVHLVYVSVFGFGDEAVDEIGPGAGDQHHDAHHEDPDQQLDLDLWIFHAEKNEGDERDASHAIGFKAVGARAQPNRPRCRRCNQQ